MRLSLIPALFLTAACALPGGTSRTNTGHNDVPLLSCDGSSSGICAFINSPVRLGVKPVNLPSRKFPFFNTIDALEFVDAGSAKWIAPADTLTDGASIPPIFIKMIGAPTSREFVNAAAVHDAYCGIGNEEGSYYHGAIWQNVHRMFYDALRVGGTPPLKAKIMFAAVYIGGPRWGGSTKVKIIRGKGGATGAGTAAGKTGAGQAAGGGASARGRLANKSLLSAGVPTNSLQAQLRIAIAFIEAKKPSIAALEKFLIRSEKNLFEQIAMAGGEETSEPSEVEHHHAVATTEEDETDVTGTSAIP